MMSEQERQKLHDFVCDIKMLSEQYGWNISEALDLIGWKPKTNNELLVEYATETYSSGTLFIPINKKKLKMSDGNCEELCDRIFAHNGTKMYLVYDPSTNLWADVIK